MIRLEAGMTTARFTRLLGLPERSYRRWQQRERQGRPPAGPWPAPARDRVEPAAVAYADRFPAWGHRKIAMLMRVDGHHAPDATVLRALRRTGRVLPVDYQTERRQHAQARRAAFVVPPLAPNQVWQFDFSEFETRHGGIWRIGGIADYWSKYELGWHVSPTQNHRDAIETIEQALAETERLLGATLRDLVTDRETGVIRPVALVTDNGPCIQGRRLRGVRRQAPGADPYPHPGQESRPERRPRARLRLVEVRAPLPARDRRRLHARTRVRELPAALQPGPAARSARHETTARGPPRSDPRRSDHQLKRARNPATFVTRDSLRLRRRH